MQLALHFVLSISTLFSFGSFVAAQNASGVVRDAKGNPVPNVEVRIAVEDHTTELQHGGFKRVDGQRVPPKIMTNADGHFEIEAPTPPYTIVAVHPVLGIGQRFIAETEAAHDVTLQAWGHLEVVVTHGDGSPVPGETLMIDRAPAQMVGEPLIWWRHQAKTDVAGKFAIERVPPGYLRIWRSTNPVYRKIGSAKIAPGETSVLNLDFDGTRVRGNLSLPESIIGPGLLTTVLLSSDTEFPLRPDDVRRMSPTERLRWRASDVGQKFADSHCDALSKMYDNQCQVAADGTFAMEHIPPGRYTLSFQSFVLANPPRVIPGRPQPFPTAPDRDAYRGYYTCQIEVPATSITRDVIIPAIEIRPYNKQLAAGDPLPPIELPSLAERSTPLKLDSLKGKFILLDFWATYCGPCIANEPKLKALHERFNGDRFEIVGITFDKTAERPNRHLRSHILPWKQHMLSDEQRDRVGQQFVTGLPTYVLVNPAGTIVMRTNDIEDATRAVESAVGDGK